VSPLFKEGGGKKGALIKRGEFFVTFPSPSFLHYLGRILSDIFPLLLPELISRPFLRGG
jgi:hypothetical protein